MINGASLVAALGHGGPGTGGARNGGQAGVCPVRVGSGTCSDFFASVEAAAVTQGPRKTENLSIV